MATNNPRHGYERNAASLKPRRWGKRTGRNAVARLAHSWTRRKPESSIGSPPKERLRSPSHSLQRHCRRCGGQIGGSHSGRDNDRGAPR